MRKQLFNVNSRRLVYGIREVVNLAKRIGEMDPHFEFIGENIGDPIAKGWRVPGFVKQILTDLIRLPNDQVFGYTHSYGRFETRRWVADLSRRLSPASRLDADHVIFANGLGAAIGSLYRMIKPGGRILQPLPGYPAHFSTERYTSGGETIGYRLDPSNRWLPDLEHLESQVRRHPEVAGILVINPNNPTGAVYDAATLEAIVRIVQRYRLLLISDEVYFRMVFPPNHFVQLTDLVGRRVPLVVMRGVSKDIPWPGARSGWMEFHNTELDADYQRFFESIRRSLMMEVSSTALPQIALPLIYDHPQFESWQRRYVAKLKDNSEAMAGILARTPGLQVQPIQGAFYMMARFEPRVLNARQTLPIAAPKVRDFVRRATAVPGMPLDKRFAYYLLGATGICIVPATDFFSPWLGFRVTTLERDPDRRNRVYQKLSQSIQRYLESA